MAALVELFENSQGLDEQAIASLTDWLAAHLFATSTTATPAFPASLTSDKKPRSVFLTIASPYGFYEVVQGSGQGIQAATRQALTQLARCQWATAPTMLKLDVVRQVEPLQIAANRWPRWPHRSLHGIAIGSPSLACLAEEVMTHDLFDKQGRLQITRLHDYLAQRHPHAALVKSVLSQPATPAWRFSTDAWYADQHDRTRLYRGHPMTDRLNSESLNRSANAAGCYLAGSVSPSGRFVYSYWPEHDACRPDYNILRHAGTTWAMFDLYQQIAEPALRDAAQRAVAYLVQSIRPCRHFGAPLQCVVERGQVKLGGQGLALVCLAKHAEVMATNEHLPLMQGMAEWIVRSQATNGRFSCHKASHHSGTVSRFESGYYPGEAMLGLLRLYALDGEPRWLEAASRAAQWLIGVRDHGKTIARLDHDHWLLYALNELHRHAPSPAYLEHTRKLVQAITSTQHKAPGFADWHGGWYKPPRTTPTATRTEGLAAAYQLLRDHGGSHEELAEIKTAIEAGLRFQLDNQYSPASSLYLPNPGRALGGFRGAHEQGEIRIDYVQHSLSAILLYLRNML